MRKIAIRFLKRLLLTLLVLVLLLIGGAFLLPASAHVERSITIERPVSTLFALLNGYRRFNEWSPWALKDPRARYAISGPPSGVGAKQSWQGDPGTVGSGSQEIVASKADESITTALEFGQMGNAVGQYRFAAAGAATTIVWSFDAQMPLALDGNFVGNIVGRYMGLFMDRFVGPDFELGLQRLKMLAGTLPNVDIAGVAGAAVQLAPRRIYFVSGSSGTDPESAHRVLAEAYGQLTKFLQDNGLSMNGAPLTMTTSWDAAGWKFDAAVPVDSTATPTRTNIQAGATYAGPALQFMHVGPYDRLGDTIDKAYAWAAVHGYKTKDRLIEDYLSDPGTTPAQQLQTRVTIPVE